MGRDNDAVFTFITCVNNAASFDNSTKRQIRKQAMHRAALARVSNGRYGQHNLLQYPKDVAYRLSGTSQVGHRSTTAATLLQAIPPKVPDSITGYQAIVAKYSFHIVNLSMLTTFHVTHATVGCLSDDPSVLFNILPVQQPSYLSHVPRRYGTCVALDTAVECVAARYQHFIHDRKGAISHSVTRLYITAIRALQEALDVADNVNDVNILCAAELLGLFEVRNVVLRNRMTG